MRFVPRVIHRDLPGKARTLCPGNGPVDTCVDPATGLRSSSQPIFTCCSYEVLIRGLPGFAIRNPNLVIDR